MDCKIKRLEQKDLVDSKERIINLMWQLTPDIDNALYMQKYNELERYISDGTAIVFVAFLNETIQGYIWGYHRVHYGCERIHVTQFIVDQEYRDLGIGRALMAEMKRYSIKKGCSAIELNVLPNNIKGIRFYFSRGFEPEYIFMKKDCSTHIYNEMIFSQRGGGISMNLIDGNLTLRAIERSDNMVLKELLNDPETEKNIGGWSFPVSSEGQNRWFDNIVSENNSGRYRYAIDKDGTCVGMAGFRNIDYKNSTAQVDIKLLETYRGQGIGTTSMRLLIAYAFDELNLHCLVAEIIEDNVGSRKMHENAGFLLDGILRNRIYKNGKYHNQCAYSILKEEYEGNR